MADVDPTNLGFWQSVNWQTIVTLLIFLVPIVGGLIAVSYKYIASHARELLATERETHKQTKQEKQKLETSVADLRRGIDQFAGPQQEACRRPANIRNFAL